MLYQQYIAKKKLLESQNPKGTQNERELWHGTAPEAVSSINYLGFDRSYCGKNGKIIQNIIHLLNTYLRYMLKAKKLYRSLKNSRIWIKKYIHCPSCTNSINSYGLPRNYCWGNGENCLNIHDLKLFRY